MVVKPRNNGNATFMMTLTKKNYDALEEDARLRGCSLQDLLRVVIVPLYLKDKGIIPDPRFQSSRQIMVNRSHELP